MFSGCILLWEPPTIPTPSARQSLLPKPHGQVRIFIHHGSRRPHQRSGHRNIYTRHKLGYKYGAGGGGGANTPESVTMQNMALFLHKRQAARTSTQSPRLALSAIGTARLHRVRSRPGADSAPSPQHAACPTATAATTTSEWHGAGQLPAYHNRNPNALFRATTHRHRRYSEGVKAALLSAPKQSQRDLSDYSAQAHVVTSHTPYNNIYHPNCLLLLLCI
jgi:hypothetical protein